MCRFLWLLLVFAGFRSGHWEFWSLNRQKLLKIIYVHFLAKLQDVGQVFGLRACSSNQNNTVTTIDNKNFNIFRGLYVTQWNISDGAFIVKIVSRYVYSQKNSIVDARLGSKYAFAFT